MNAPKRFRKKPVTIEAMQFRDWGTAIQIAEWSECAYYVGAGFEHNLRHKNEYDRSNGHCYAEDAPAFLVVSTLEGPMRCDVGSWVIRGVQGEFYPIKADILAATYEEVTE